MLSNLVRKKQIDLQSLKLHKKLRGKITVESKIRKLKQKQLPLIYTPGVAAVCKRITRHPNSVHVFTSKDSNLAVVTDGSRLLGLGNVGPYAALPVMEGKAVLYKRFGRINAFPICLNTTNKSEIIRAIIAIEPTFGAINIEDIEFPKVMKIVSELEKLLKIPVFHDDRHGTAVVVLAALLNSLKMVKKRSDDVKIVIAGAGSAGYGIVQLLVFAGFQNIIVVDSSGMIYRGRNKNMNKYKKELAVITNPHNEKGSISRALVNADVFIGVSGIKNLITAKMIYTMNKQAIVFALSNPDPEIDPLMAKNAGAKIVATGSYLYQNQVNNAIVFPCLMNAVLKLKITKINLGLLYVTAKAISNTLSDNQINYDTIIPDIYDKRICKNVFSAIKKSLNQIHKT